MNTRALQPNRQFSGYTKLFILLVAAFIFTATLIYFSVESINTLNGHLLAVNISILLTLGLTGLIGYLLILEIKRRKKLTARLKQQKDNLHIILNSISEGLIATNAKGEIIFANEAAQSLIGCRYTEMKLQHAQRFFKDTNNNQGCTISNIINRVLANENSLPEENQTILRLDTNQKKVITNSGTPLINSNGNITGAVIVFSDLTEIDEKEAVLKNKDKQFLDLIKNMPQAMYTCDENGFIQIYNKAAADMWGWEPTLGKDQWCGWKKMVDPA
ncbi:MAG: hypothetical protein RL115_1815, partial [Bacteroidota bacterium]